MPILNMIYWATWSWPTPEIWATNLVGYRPLQSDANDHKADVWASWTTYDWTWSWTATYGAVSWRTWASFSNNSYIDTGVSIWNRPLSYALSLLKTDNWDYWRTAFWQNKNRNPNYWILGQESKIFVHWWDSSDSAIVSNYSINTRYNIVVTTDGSWTIKYYLNWSLIGTKSWWQDITWYNWCIARGIGNYCNWAYMSHCAIWEKELDASEISAFNTYINS